MVGAMSLLVVLTGCASNRDDAASRDALGSDLPGVPNGVRTTAPSAPLPISTDLATASSEHMAGLEPVIVRGRGRTRARGRINLAQADPGRTIVLNFDNVEITEVAAVVLGELLDVNYSVDPAVKGKANIKSTKPVPVGAALGVLETILKQNDAALVIDNGLYRVVPAAQAPAYASALGSDGRSIPPGYSVRVVPLNYIAASEMAEILEPFTEDSGVLRIDQERNLIILAGMSRDLALWLETVETFDVDWFAGKSVGIFPLTEVSAEQIIVELRAIFDRTEDDETGVIEFLPIERLNAVMAISQNPALIDRVQEWLDRLDRGSPSGRRLFVYRMKNGKADELAPILQNMFASGDVLQVDGDYFAGSSGLAPGMAPSTVSTMAASGGSPSMTRGEQLATNTRLAGTNTRLAGQGRLARQQAQGIRIVANESMNSLLILATPAEYRGIEAALRQLDIQPLQVLVEATIAEVTITNDLRFGVQYFLEGTIFQEEFTATLSNTTTGALASTFPGFSFVTGAPVRGILDALEGITKVNVISSPNLMVKDNQTASLVVGDEIPVTVRQQQGTVDESNIINTIEFRDTGVIFEVTPHVGHDGTISMDITQEASSVAPSATPTLTPTISQRRITSSVVVGSGETIILGGLFSENVNKTRSGLPFLSRIPILGWLFGQTNNTTTRTELVVLISPRIMRNQVDGRQLTDEFRARLRQLDAFSARGREQIGIR